MIVYFSTISENTHRFVTKLGLPARRIPLSNSAAAQFMVDSPYVLIVPSYGGGKLEGAVPKPVIHFLNQKSNRDFLRGVIGAGNINFGEAYGIAGRVIAKKCQVPLLYKFELLGTSDDVQRVRTGVQAFLQASALGQ